MALELKDLSGYELGERVLEYDDRDAIIYALAVGASSQQLDLVYEKSLQTLPCYAAALGLWAVESAGELGAYDRKRSLHASQQLVIHKPMPPGGRISTWGRVSAVWDKGKSALLEIEVTSEVFTAIYGIFLPGLGGWGGDRGPSAPREEPIEMDWAGSYRTSPDQAVLYRLTGDRHPVHIDDEVARANGFERPILHGLCTLGIAARMVADAVAAHPASLRDLQARLAAPVMPGDTIEIVAGSAPDGTLHFELKTGELVVLKSGQAKFGNL